MYESPLTAAHRERGASLRPFKGALVPDAFGELAAEVTAAREGAAVVDLAWLAHVRVTGRHRQRFVHAMCTCQVKALTPGDGNFGMVLEGKGKLIAQFHVDAEADALRLELAREDAEATVAQLLRFRVADLVDFNQDPGRTVLSVVGPAAGDTLSRAGAPVAPLEREYAFIDTTLGDVAARVRRNAGRVGLPGFDVTVAAEDAPRAWDALLAAGAAPLGQAAWDALRVAGGYPVDGVDVDATNVPLEAERLAATIDWKKGCYLGQEVVCMMNDRGQPGRILRGLALPAGPTPELAPGTELVGAPGEDKAVARLGTIARLPGRDAAVALAVVKRKHAEPGTTLYLPDGRAATVLALPLG